MSSENLSGKKFLLFDEEDEELDEKISMLLNAFRMSIHLKQKL